MHDLVAWARSGPGRELLRQRPDGAGADEQVGADGWELAGLEERREGGDGRTYWDAAWSLTTYTFKRLVPRTYDVQDHN
jgi:hypothetical protein